MADRLINVFRKANLTTILSRQKNSRLDKKYEIVDEKVSTGR